eukprot:1866278-Pyramimonas_sp.AAC.1
MTVHTGLECMFAHRGATPPLMASRKAGEIVVTQRLRTGPECAPVHRGSDTGGSGPARGRS